MELTQPTSTVLPRAAAARADIFLWLGVLLLSGCTAYSPLPLPQQPALSPSLAELRITTPADGAHRSRVIDIENGVDLTDVAILAVLNNPQLRAQRAGLCVAEAQSFAAGLLPDPQLSAGMEKPTSARPGESVVNAYTLGLGYELQALITRQSRVAAARAGAQQVRLDLLWLEWQTAQQAQSIAVRSVLESRQIQLLEDAARLALARSEASAAALRNTDITLTDYSVELIAHLDADTQLAELRRVHADTLAGLNLLLGLQEGASVPVQLPAASDLPAIDSATSVQHIGTLSSRRPDLLALQAGYRSQEESLRGAVLAQFPALSMEAGKARDTGDVRTNTFSIGLTLPLFDRNRGAIAIETATRGQLLEEYRSRLAQTEIDARTALRQQAELRRQQTALAQTRAPLEQLRNNARAALARGDIDSRSAREIESAWLAKRLESLAVTQGIWENALLLDTLLATPVAQLARQQTQDQP